MQNQAFNDFAEFGKKSLGLARNWSDIQFSLLNNLVKQQNEMAGLYLQGGVKQLELLGKAKSTQELLTEQAKLAESLGKQVVGNVFATSEIFSNSANQMSDWLEKSWEVARGASQAAAAAH